MQKSESKDSVTNQVSFDNSEIDIYKRAPSMGNVSFRMLGENKEQGYVSRVKAVLTNLSFMALCLSLSGLFFVVTGIQFWFSDYLKKEFGKEV